MLASLLAAFGQPVTGRVAQVAVPSAVCMAVSDSLALLVVGERTTNDCQLWVFRLDQEGNPNTQPVRLTLACPGPLTNHTNYPLGLSFHPKLPLLYVWQDIGGVTSKTPEEATVFNEFNHLSIYSIKDNVLQLMQSCACGTNYAYGQDVGVIALDPAGKKLFLPNLHDLKSYRPAVGCLFLDTNGVPIVAENEEAGTNTVGVEVETFMADVGEFQNFPTGWGYLPVSEKVVIFSGTQGPVTWDVENRLSALNWMQIYGAPNSCFIGGHPAFPVVFGVGYAGGFVYRLAHAEGYITLLPQTMSIPGAAFQSQPVVMSKEPSKVAIGGVNRVHFLAIDKNGNFGGSQEEMAVASSAVRAIAYSSQFDRLYVAVEKIQ